MPAFLAVPIVAAIVKVAIAAGSAIAKAVVATGSVIANATSTVSGIVSNAATVAVEATRHAMVVVSDMSVEVAKTTTEKVTDIVKNTAEKFFPKETSQAKKAINDPANQPTINMVKQGKESSDNISHMQDTVQRLKKSHQSGDNVAPHPASETHDNAKTTPGFNSAMAKQSDMSIAAGLAAPSQAAAQTVEINKSNIPPENNDNSPKNSNKM